MREDLVYEVRHRVNLRDFPRRLVYVIKALLVFSEFDRGVRSF